MQTLMRSLMAETKASFQVGIAGYETILAAVGLDGEVNGDLRRSILELAETRHVNRAP